MNITKDGRHIVRFTKSFDIYSVGTRASFLPSIAEKLVKDGIAVHTNKRGAPPTQAKDDPDLIVIEDETEQTVEESADPLADLGVDWKNQHGAKLIALAKKITEAPISTKADAIAAIEAELETRAGE